MWLGSHEGDSAQAGGGERIRAEEWATRKQGAEGKVIRGTEALETQ